jgi:hypothetical protein
LEGLSHHSIICSVLPANTRRVNTFLSPHELASSLASPSWAMPPLLSSSPTRQKRNLVCRPHRKTTRSSGRLSQRSGPSRRTVRLEAGYRDCIYCRHESLLKEVEEGCWETSDNSYARRTREQSRHDIRSKQGYSK